MNSVSLIISLGREGKDPRAIARELHARGVFDERGRAISPEMVSGFLRFIGSPLDSETNYLPALFGAISSEAAWSVKRPPSINRFELSGDLGEATPDRPRKNRGRRLSDELKAEVTRLFQEGVKPNEIAKM